MDIIIISRHENTIKKLKQELNLPAETKAIAEASPEDVRGKHVIGNLPLHLAAEAAKITAPTIIFPSELRGKDLTDEQFDACYKGVATYKIEKAEF